MNPHRSDEQPPSLEAASPSLTMPSSLTYTASTWQNPQTLIIPGRQFGQSVPVVRWLRILMQVDTSSCLSSTSPAKGHARYACQYASNDICNEVPSRDKGGRFGIGVECRMSVMARTTPPPPSLPTPVSGPAFILNSLLKRKIPQRTAYPNWQSIILSRSWTLS